MKYYICQLNDSGISSNNSYISDLDGNIIRLNPYDSSSQEWGQIEYDLLESFESGIQEIDILWNVSRKDITSAYKNHMRFEPTDDNVIFGLTPFGNIATWLSKDTKQRLLSWSTSIEDNSSCKTGSYSNRMVQYTYKYIIAFNSWNNKECKWEPTDKVFEFESLEEYLLDGTFDKENNGSLFKLHNAGIPYKLQLKWRIGKSEYIAYFFFVQESIIPFFEKFFGAHPNTKTDLTIRIDPIGKKYEISLYRYGLHSPVVISEDCYQLIVFKSGFENFKSTNYSQENGAWIW